MNTNFWSIAANKIMSRVVFTVGTVDKVEEAAILMAQHQINALPVIDESGACVGIITSQKIVEYEAIRNDVHHEIEHGYLFDLARYGVDEAPLIARIRFDDIDHHMNRNVVFAAPQDTLQFIAEKMCQNHSHHAVVLDESAGIEGIISSLDILAAGTSKCTC